jgi:type I restriction-modification system DNA methylase subunit
MANETLTENLVYDHFKNDPLFSDKIIKTLLERQQSSNPKIDSLLKGQSKGEGKGSGRPDFIITFPTNSDYVIAIECKADIAKHESQNKSDLKNIRDYAVDGVLHYARALSEGFNVLAIAVSGETLENLTISHYLWKKGVESYIEKKEDNKLLSINDYLKMFENEHFSDNLLHINIVDKAIYLNELFHAYSIQENERCTLVSAVLLALTYKPFRLSYQSHTTTNALTNSILDSCNNVINLSGVRNIPQMLNEYSKLNSTVLFSSDTIRNTKTRQNKQTLDVLKTEVVTYLYENIYPLLSKEEKGFDVLGKFYSEFIRYAGSQQSLGLVLTPQHITDLFCDLGEVTKDDVLYDCCCGTGGFLISGMKRMSLLAGNDSEKKLAIRKNQLCGAEVLPQMYTYACSNMMLRGDGKSNIYNGDCFSCLPFIKPHKPTKAFLNPPYNVGSDGQMKFIEHALNVVAPQNGTVVAIVQMSCAIKNERELIAVKRRILEKHHLKAVLSMPDDLFYPVGVVTCIMVFESNKPNAGLETFFGYFKDDGFEKRKNQGRIDVRNHYEAIKEKWLHAYNNKKATPGLSVMQEVTADEEWCAEAYMETDYSNLNDMGFIKKMRDYIAFLVSISNPFEYFEYKNIPISSNKISNNTENWKWFVVGELFECSTTNHTIQQETIKGNIPFVTRSALNNGVSGFINDENLSIYEGNCITIGAEGIVAFYQPKTFATGVKVYIIRHANMNVYNAMFIITILNLENYRYNYGNARILNKIQREKIKLPATKEGKPDWEFMENYIKSLPYSACL